VKNRTKDPGSGWWSARFHVNWPENSEPSWHIDLLLAHRGLSPILRHYKDHLHLWRFHRRAARDQVGHRFSFMFYSSPEIAHQVYGSLRSDPLLKDMREAGVLVRETYDDPSKIIKPNIEDTSDPNWSPLVQKSWPYFIMGVCQMWMDLIASIAESASIGRELSSLQAISAFYQEVGQAVTRLWQEEGCHSLLHHLNAIFGYQPVKVVEARLMRF